uniref:Permease 1 heavy chain n=1 Tax=Schistosoma japonicum TaxID=6182 RepID=B9P3Q9_SCHJA|nr:permease 1 heavy chain [Schistosoma japonicum]
MSLSGTNGRVPIDEEVGFLPTLKDSTDTNENNVGQKDTYCLLTREDLMQLDSKEPFWYRLRWGLFILFWVVWVGLLLAAILIIVFTPKCPPRPVLPFWRSTTGYWVNPFAYEDSSNDKIGDLKGLAKRLDYIKGTIGAGFIVLSSIFSGQYTNDLKTLGLVDDYFNVDPALGTMEDFKNLVRSCHKNGIYLILTMDFNSVSAKHPWTEFTYLLEPYSSKKVSRLGGDARTVIQGVSYYSVFGSHFVDLNLRETGALDRIADVAKFWLNEGIDGILLDNVAFYIENGTESGAPITKELGSQWFSKYPTSQIYISESVEVVRKIRKVVDEMSESSGKPKLLAVDAGNTGYGVGKSEDISMQFLGTKDSPAAHVVVSRQFVKHRGWKAPPIDPEEIKNNIFTYDMLSVSDRNSMALTTVSTSDSRQSDLVALAATVLLPGTCLLYYGSELNEGTENVNFTGDFYPFDEKTIFTGSKETDVLLSQLAMPWDQAGVGFSPALTNSTSFTEYLKRFGLRETVESATSSGRGATPFSLVQDLIAIRRNESLLWGDFRLLKSSLITEGLKFQIFERKAEGFPAFIIVLRNEPNVASGTFDFSSVCSNIIPKIIYPANKNFPIDQEVSSQRVYLHSSGEPMVYVFKCA